MSSPAPIRLVDLRTGPRRFLAVACVVLFAACVAAAIQVVQARRAWAAVATRVDLPRREPAIWATANVIEDSDEAAMIVGEALLSIAPADVREVAWSAVSARPGSAQGWLLLARTAQPGEPVPRWSKPLKLAIAAAPGLDSASFELANRYLAGWATLPPADQQDAEALLRQAFESPEFLTAKLAAVVHALGPERAVALLPEDRGALELSGNVLREQGEAAASQLVGIRLAALPAASRPAP